MKKTLSLLVIGFLLVSCEKTTTETETPSELHLTTVLFEKDGIKVYRFFDKGHYHYFTSKGETISNQTNGFWRAWRNQNQHRMLLQLSLASFGFKAVSSFVSECGAENSD